MSEPLTPDELADIAEFKAAYDRLSPARQLATLALVRMAHDGLPPDELPAAYSRLAAEFDAIESKLDTLTAQDRYALACFAAVRHA